MDASRSSARAGLAGRITASALALGSLIAILIALHPTDSVSAESAAYSTPAEARAAFIDSINRARVAAGMPAYISHPLLEELAQAHADYMISSGRFSHYGPNGLSARSRILNAGFPGHRAGENYVSRKNAEEAVRWLLNDPPHRNNVLHTLYNAHGVGVARTQWGDWLFVQDLVFDPSAAAQMFAPTNTPETSTAASDNPESSEAMAPLEADPGGEGDPGGDQAAETIAPPAVDPDVEPVVELAGEAALLSASGPAIQQGPDQSAQAEVVAEAQAPNAPTNGEEMVVLAAAVEPAPIESSAAVEPVDAGPASASVGDVEPASQPIAAAAVLPPYGFRVPRGDGFGMDVPSKVVWAEVPMAASPSDSVDLSGTAVTPSAVGWIVPLISALVVLLVIMRFSGRP